MPMKNSVWDIAAIRALVREWYGLSEIDEFEAQHPEVPACLWEYVNHTVRHVRMWAREELCVDLVVWSEVSQSHRMIQDIVFKDAFEDAQQWHQEVFEYLKSPGLKVWIVTHDE
jgi:hypothetical protein